MKLTAQAVTGEDGRNLALTFGFATLKPSDTEVPINDWVVPDSPEGYEVTTIRELIRSIDLNLQGRVLEREGYHPSLKVWVKVSGYRRSLFLIRGSDGPAIAAIRFRGYGYTIKVLRKSSGLGKGELK